MDSRSPWAAPVARLAHTSATRASSSAAGTLCVTSPYAAASAPLKTSPPRVVRAAARGFIRWWTVRLMIAAASPSLTSVSAKVASSALIAMSAAAMMPMPPARTAPEVLGDDRLVERHHEALEVDDPPGAHLHALGGRLAQVGAGAEDLARALDQHDLDLVVGPRALDPLEQLGHELPAEGVAVVGGVEGDGRDGVRDGVVHELGHAPTSCRRPIRAAPGTEQPDVLTRLLQALYGVLATLVGMAAAHLVAALTVPAASPVLAVGSTVIDLTPTPVKEWAIRTFGTADKAILVGSVLVVVLVLAGVAGIVAARRLTLGITMLVGLAAVAGVLALLRPSAGALDLVPSAVAALVGALTLAGLYRFAGTGAAAGHSRRAPPSATTAVATDHAEPAGASASRRTVLIATGGAALAAAAIAGAGRWVSAVRLRGTDITLPTAADTAPALPAGLEERVPGISAFRTPNDDFYRVDTALTVPAIDVDSWSLTIDGDVDEEVELSFDDLAGMRLVERDITLTCVSNDVGGPYIGAARWLGVPLQDVLDKAGVDATGADQILCTDVDGMTISVPLKVALDGRDALVAIGHERRAAAPRARLPGADGRPRALRLRQRLQVDHAG